MQPFSNELSSWCSRASGVWPVKRQLLSLHNICIWYIHPRVRVSCNNHYLIKKIDLPKRVNPCFNAGGTPGYIHERKLYMHAFKCISTFHLTQCPLIRGTDGLACISWFCQARFKLFNIICKIYVQFRICRRVEGVFPCIVGGIGGSKLERWQQLPHFQQQKQSATFARNANTSRDGHSRYCNCVGWCWVGVCFGFRQHSVWINWHYYPKDTCASLLWCQCLWTYSLVVLVLIRSH